MGGVVLGKLYIGTPGGYHPWKILIFDRLSSLGCSSISTGTSLLPKVISTSFLPEVDMQMGTLQDKYQIKDPKPPVLHFLSEPFFYSFPNAYDYIKERLKCKLCQLYKTFRGSLIHSRTTQTELRAYPQRGR